MFDKKKQRLQNPNDFDENDDVILPDTYWGEIVYIYYILKDIIKNPDDRKRKFDNLLRQIRIHIRWMKVR